jgi:phage terminase small subunit
MTDLKPKFNKREEIFIVEYLAHGNASLAAKNAGYSEKYAGDIGHKLINREKIREEIGRLKEKSIAMAGLSAQYVLESLKEIAETYKLKSPQSALRALELLGKHLGLWNADSNDRNRRPHELTDKELIALGMELAKGKEPKAIEATIT